jgi:hypothetical protein
MRCGAVRVLRDIPYEKIPKDLLELTSHIVRTKAGQFHPVGRHHGIANFAMEKGYDLLWGARRNQNLQDRVGLLIGPFHK